MFEPARQSALHCLELNPNDGWAMHTLCHYHEYTNDTAGGIKLLRDTEKDWSVCDLLSCHNYWHLALFHIENGDHHAALDLFDQSVSTNLALDRTFDMVDFVSTLVRLKLDGCTDLGERWAQLHNIYVKRFV